VDKVDPVDIVDKVFWDRGGCSSGRALHAFWT